MNTNILWGFALLLIAFNFSIIHSSERDSFKETANFLANKINKRPIVSILDIREFIKTLKENLRKTAKIKIPLKRDKLGRINPKYNAQDAFLLKKKKFNALALLSELRDPKDLPILWANLNFKLGSLWPDRLSGNESLDTDGRGLYSVPFFLIRNRDTAIQTFFEGTANGELKIERNFFTKKALKFILGEKRLDPFFELGKPKSSFKKIEIDRIKDVMDFVYGVGKEEVVNEKKEKVEQVENTKLNMGKLNRGFQNDVSLTIEKKTFLQNFAQVFQSLGQIIESNDEFQCKKTNDKFILQIKKKELEKHKPFQISISFDGRIKTHNADSYDPNKNKMIWRFKKDDKSKKIKFSLSIE